MENHITNQELQLLMENFINENPYADSFELAMYMFNAGYEKGMSETC